ncbi:MAG: hypothetical protein M3220_12980, partial [Chloroflexota bacterium]|nr:hypothetical protein [Chloroflexota bacterium]
QPVEIPIRGWVKPSGIVESEVIHLLVAGAAYPVIVQTSGANLTSPEGTPLPAACAGLYARLSVEGEWMERERRLTASRISVRELAPARMPRAQRAGDDTVAYLIGGGLERDGLASERTLLALGRDGSLRPLVDLTHLSVQRLAGQSEDALLAWEIPGCAQRWLFLYNARRGVVGQWLTAPSFGRGELRAFWRDAPQDIVLFGRATPESAGAMWHVGFLEVDRDEGPFVVPQATLDAASSPLGWLDGQGYVLSRMLGEGKQVVGLLDDALDRFAVRGSVAGDGPVISDLLVDGERLLYMVPQQFDGVRGGTVRLLDLTSGEERPGAWVTPDVIVYLAPRGEGGGAFLTQRGPAGTWRPTLRRVVIVDLARHAEMVWAIEVGDEAHIGSIAACPDGSLLYAVEQVSGQEIRRWHVDERDERLLHAPADTFQVWACP